MMDGISREDFMVLCLSFSSIGYLVRGFLRAGIGVFGDGVLGRKLMF